MKIFITFYFNQDIIEPTGIVIVITIFKKEG